MSKLSFNRLEALNLLRIQLQNRALADSRLRTTELEFKKWAENFRLYLRHNKKQSWAAFIKQYPHPAKMSDDNEWLNTSLWSHTNRLRHRLETKDRMRLNRVYEQMSEHARYNRMHDRSAAFPFG